MLGDPHSSTVLNPLRAELARPRIVDQLVEYLGQLPQRAGTGQDVLRDEVAGPADLRELPQASPAPRR